MQFGETKQEDDDFEAIEEEVSLKFRKKIRTLKIKED